MTNLSLKINTDRAQQLISSLANAAEGLPEFRDALIDFLETGEELFLLDCDGRSATLTGELVIGLYPSDGLRSLVTAFGAGDSDLLLLEQGAPPVDLAKENTTFGDAQ